jgi:uncharacterized protein YqgC (DUF456 family)
MVKALFSLLCRQGRGSSTSLHMLLSTYRVAALLTMRVYSSMVGEVPIHRPTRLSYVGKEATVVYVYAVVVTVLNLVFWVGILFSLPGTWLMVLVTTVLKWWQPEYVQVSWTMLSVAGGLALLGEVLEFALGAAGSRRAGGSIRAAALAIVGSLVGGVAGTALPVPIIGTLIGACVGAFAGSLLGDLWAGRPLFPSFEAGWGAAVGRFWGTISKLAIGAIIVLVLALDAFF